MNDCETVAGATGVGKHTPEPWKVRGPREWWSKHPIYQNISCAIEGDEDRLEANGFEVATLPNGCPDVPPTDWDKTCDVIQKANAERIVACVNALAGKNPAAVQKVVEAAEKMVGCGCATEDEYRYAVARNNLDELAAALADLTEGAAVTVIPASRDQLIRNIAYTCCDADRDMDVDDVPEKYRPQAEAWLDGYARSSEDTRMTILAELKGGAS